MYVKTIIIIHNIKSLVRHLILFFNIKSFKSSELICISSVSLSHHPHFKCSATTCGLRLWIGQLSSLSSLRRFPGGTKLCLLVVGTYSWTCPCWLPVFMLGSHVCFWGPLPMKVSHETRRSPEGNARMKVLAEVLELAVHPLIHSPVHPFSWSFCRALF